MAAINETLTLTDQFSSSFRTFIDLGNRAVRTTENLDRSLTGAMGKSAGAIVGEIRQLNTQLGQQYRQMQEIVREQGRHTQEAKRTRAEAGSLLRTFRTLAVATGAISLAKSFLSVADAQAQITARLNLMNDGLQTTGQLNEMIYQSALRSRAAYADTADAIGKMGLNAGNAFGSNQELIAFMEQVNKQFAIGGASATEQKNAMLQLTQAMGAGALRGDELNSILDAAPGIARSIEQSMGWASGSIKQYAEDGQVTAQVVKNSLLNMAEETNRKFNEMPMTMSQAMTTMQSVVQHSVQDMAAEWNDFINSADGQRLLGEMISLFSTLASVGVDALAAVGQMGLFAANNLDFIIPILAGVALAFALVKVQAIRAGIVSIMTALQSGAAWAAAHWPIILLAALFAAALIAAQQFGLGMQQVGGFVGQVFGLIYAVGYNTFAMLWNVIAVFAEFFANVFNDPVAAIAHLFAGALDTILSMVETVAGAIDALTGSDLQGAVSGFRGKLSSWVDDTFGENAVQIKRMASLDVGATSSQWGQYGANLGTKLDDLNLNLGDLAGSLGGLNFDTGSGGLGDIGKVGKVGSLGQIDGDVNLSDEDVKLYRDLAERRYMNQVELKTLAPNISVSIPESAAKNLTGQDIADKLKAVLLEQASAHTAVAHG